MTVRILVGHVLDRLAELADESVHCVVSSPPYYGLREYGIEPQVWGGGWRGSLGLEPTLDLYLDHMVEVFREVRRVMRKDATCWLNIGDAYANDGKWGGHTGGKHVKALHASPIGRNKRYTGFKPKDLMLIPSRLAIRLQDDGWWVRSDIAWCKRAPMPESCTDRPTTAWEHIFLLTKSAKYFYDAEAVKEAAERAGDIPGGNYAKRLKQNETLASSSWATGKVPSKRNLRNFWLLGPEPFPEAHFATFSTEIPRRAILAGTSEKGVCPKCGAPWERRIRTQRTRDGGPLSETETIGWQPTCGCGAGNPVPATVLDPFGGAGTTGLVADQLRRDAILIELNPEYAAMAEARIRADNSLFTEIAAE